jgi:hypothetical protein
VPAVDVYMDASLLQGNSSDSRRRKVAVLYPALLLK